MNPDAIIKQIMSLENQLLKRQGGRVVLAEAGQISETLGKISVLLANLSEPVFEAELEYKLTRAARYDRMLKDGEKRTVAEANLKYDQELIQKELAVDRIKGYIKRTEQLITTMQTHIKVLLAQQSNLM